MRYVDCEWNFFSTDLIGSKKNSEIKNFLVFLKIVSLPKITRTRYLHKIIVVNSSKLRNMGEGQNFEQ